MVKVDFFFFYFY
jgi:hypothetical protein